MYLLDAERPLPAQPGFRGENRETTRPCWSGSA